MAGQGNAERCNGSAQLGIDLTGTEMQRNCTATNRWKCTEKQRHGDEKLSPDQK
nr:MAG TPA: hypothetical protein [Bacteriophage sp.]